MKAVWIERPFLRRAQPHVVVYGSGRISIGEHGRSSFPIQVSPGPNQPDPSQLATLHVVHGFLSSAENSAAEFPSHDTVVPARRLDHDPPFADTDGKRFLHINILAGLASHYRGQGVPMVRCGNDDGIQIFLVEPSGNHGSRAPGARTPVPLSP